MVFGNSLFFYWVYTTAQSIELVSAVRKIPKSSIVFDVLAEIMLWKQFPGLLATLKYNFFEKLRLIERF